MREHAARHPESEWGITGAGSSSIQGFATDISVDQGQTVGFKVDTTASSYRLDIYRMGYYGGAGARRVATVPPTVLNSQPNCVTNTATGLVDCGNWTQNASWAVPASAVSGIYFAKLVRTDGTAGSSHVFFVVRDDDGGSDLLFQTSDTTWQAYNTYGGNSLYTGAPAGRAYKVSYNRPFTTRGNAPEDWVFNAEYPMVRFLESNGYDVSYTTGVDTDRRGAELLEHEAFLSVGHDEYWSGTQRSNVEAARAAGVDLAFFSGNEVFWKTRWENSIDGSGTPHRTLVTYKETHANAKIDPLTNVWTGTWRDPRFSPPADGGRPENALSGQIFTINCCAINMVVGQADGQMRFWRNTRVASLAAGATTTVGTNVVGYEWDEDLDNGHRPPGSFRVSQTAGSGDRITDHGTSYAQGQATHSMTMYKAPSGALVFGAGTIQWAWALDGEHDRGSAAPDTAAQQATVNLFADMGVQPDTMRPGLTAATASTDTTAPTATITAPAAGATLPVGTPVTVTGTAADTGGRVGGVEVSTDNGTTWRRATGRGTWTYTFTPSAAGALTMRARAVDDSANIGAAATTNVTVGTAPATCPCSIWPGTATPDRTDPDRDPVEVGVKFRASTDGLITGIRYYKPVETSGTHVGSPVDQHRHPARPGDLHQRVGERLAAGELRHAHPGHGRHDVRRLLLLPDPLLRELALLRDHWHHPWAADGPPGRRRRRQRRLPLHVDAQHLPRPDLPERELLGRRRLHRGRRHRQAHRHRPHASPRGHRRRARRGHDGDVQRGRPAVHHHRRAARSRRSRGAGDHVVRRDEPHRDRRPDERARRDHHLHRQRQRRPRHRRQPDGRR